MKRAPGDLNRSGRLTAYGSTARMRGVRWAVTAFAALLVILALAIAVALLMRSANAL
jgi:hypothetical protein